MVTAKYTESTPVQPVDFTAAAGAGAEAWAKTAQEVSSDAFKRLTNLKMEEAVSQGSLEGAKGAEAQPMSGGTAYATRFNQALEQSAQIDVHTKAIDHFSQLNKEYTAKPATLENAQEYAAKGEAYVTGVIQHAPPSMQGGLQNTLKPLYQSFKGQYGDYTYKQQVQNNELNDRLQIKQVVNDGALAITKGGLVDPTLTQTNYDNSRKLIFSKRAVSTAQKLAAADQLADTYAGSLNDFFFQTTKNQLQNGVNSKNAPQIQAAQDTLNKYASDSASIARTLKRNYPLLKNYPLAKLEKIVRVSGTDYRHGVAAQGRQLKHEFDTAHEKQKLGYKVSGDDIVNLSSAAGLVPTGNESLDKIKSWNNLLDDTDSATHKVGGLQNLLQTLTNPAQIKYVRTLQRQQETDAPAYLNRINRDQPLAQTMPLAPNVLPDEERIVKTAINDPFLGKDLLNDKYNSIDKNSILNAIDQRKHQGNALGIPAVHFFTNEQAKNTVAQIQEMPTAVARGEAWNKLRTLGISPTDTVSQVHDASPGDMAEAAFSNNQIKDIVKNSDEIHKVAVDRSKTDVDTSVLTLARNPTMIALQQSVKPKLFQTIQKAVQGIGDNLTLGNTVRGLDMDFTHVFGFYHESVGETDQNQIIDFVLKDMGVNKAATQPLLIPQSIKGVALNAFQVSRNADVQAKLAYNVAWTPSGEDPDWHHYLSTYGFGEAPRAEVLAQYKELFKQIGEQGNADNRAAYFSNWDATHYVARSGSGLVMYYKNADGSRGNRMVGEIAALEEGHL